MRKTIPAAAAIAALLTIETSAGTVLLHDDFSDLNTDDWVTMMNPVIFDGAQVHDASGGNYRVELPRVTDAAWDAGAHSYFEGLRPDVTVSNFRQSVDILEMNGIAPISSLMARRNGVDFSPGHEPHTGGGYYLATYPSSSQPGNQVLEFGRMKDGMGELGTEVRQYFPGDGTGEYRLVFEGVGDQFRGSIYDLGNLSIPLATLSANDATFASGFSGIASWDLVGWPARVLNVPTSLTFDNFTVESVPEGDGNVVVLAAAFMVGLGVYMRRS